MGEEQGKLLALLGSDSEHAARGNEAMDSCSRSTPTTRSPSTRGSPRA